MIRITALNDETSRSSDDDIIHPKEPSQEVQEENALKSYNEALLDQKNGDIDKAETVYKQLLNSNLLLKVKPDKDCHKGKKSDNICSLYGKPSIMLKYSCLKNMGVISLVKNKLDEALDYYTQALDIEGSDVSVWFKAGDIALKLLYIGAACDFFFKGLECSPKNWLCLDKLIICLFVLGDFINCLYQIARAFALDPNYTRGHILRDQMFTEQASLAVDIKLYFPKINLYVNKKIVEVEDMKAKLLKEVLSIRTEYYETLQKQTKIEQSNKQHFIPSKNIENQTWLGLGEYILRMHTEITDEKKNISILSSIYLCNALNENKEKIKINYNYDMENIMAYEPYQDDEGQGTKNSSKVQNEDGEKKNKKNRGSALMEELLWGGKRRSARVRSSLRGNPEPMDVAEALHRILPRKLLHKTKQAKSDQTDGKLIEEKSMDTMDLYRLFERQESAEERRQKEEQERSEVEHDIDKVVESEHYFGTKEEMDDILYFIETNNRKNIIDIVKSFVLALESHWKKTWPNLLPSIYIKCFQTMKKYHQTNFKMCHAESGFRELVLEAGSVLLYGELCLEHNSSNRNLNQNNQKLDTHLEVPFMQNIMELIERNYLFENDEKYFEFLIRLYWLRCHLFLIKGQSNLALATLHELLSCYELYPEYASNEILLKNNRKNNIISKTVVEEFLVYQSRKKSLAEVVRLYEDASYQELTEILKETFTSTTDDTGSQFKDQENELVNRQTQLSMLINGLYHLNEYKECLYWLEMCCYELLQKTPVSTFYQAEKPEEESWMITLDRILIAMEDCVILGNLTLDEALPHSRLSRFVQTLCHAICKELEDSDRPPCPARPWIMLNRILMGLESQDGSSVENEDDENDIPSSVLILFTAHEYLGRREWCNCNESILLFLIMDQVIPHIRSPEWSSFRETIQQHLEQVVYCLYSHPSKKAKARYLTEHNVSSIPLTWNRGIQLFDLFRPDDTPSYDSLRINLIGSETEVLFRRIAALIPDENDPVQNSEKMMDFIVGKRNDVPDATVRLPTAVKDLFYILGDYYFKTHESAKAVNYLLIDLCANPDRVDSWASMALSRASILEQQLNSCDPVKDEARDVFLRMIQKLVFIKVSPYYLRYLTTIKSSSRVKSCAKPGPLNHLFCMSIRNVFIFLQDALSALRCYEHCLQLDSNQCALWIEYGTFVYTIHSFCSQRMKLESLSLGMEKFEELETTKNKMLDTAKQAFLNANLIWYELKDENERQDERWLHHYMLGKISEKHGDLTYFDHYEKAAELLYENEAEYPSKIGYTTPQTLAVEALEVYYRIHVCVIKNLELNEGKPLDSKTRQIFKKYLELAGKSHFVTQISKSDLAKMKAKEAEAAVQNAKQMKIIKDLLDEIITKIENGENKKEVVKEIMLDSEKDQCNDDSITEIIVLPDNPSKENENELEKSKSDLIEVINLDLVHENSIQIVEEKKLSDPAKTRGYCSVIKQNESVIKKENKQQQEVITLNKNYEYPEYQESDSRYFITLDDLRNEVQPVPVPPKKKRRASQRSASSSSCESDVKYDDSTSSSSSSESSDSSPSSSSSSKDSSQSEVTNKESVKVSEDEGKMKINESTPEEASTPETGDAEEKSNSPAENTEDDLLSRCILALETCAIRFPQHYKSVYRLAHFYFRSKEHRDLGKCKDLLLGRYQTPHGTITGLFADRKNTNFFNGIWRIPAGDVDRPGSFASHMSRSVLLLMEVLRDLKDHKMLLELCLQLRKVPEPDKKYLREDERNQLSVQAINLSIKTLRKSVSESTVMTLPIVLDTYRCYQKVQKHYSHRESSFGDILLDAFKRLGKGDKCSLEQAIRFCQSELSTPKSRPRNMNTNSVSVPKPKIPKVKKEEKKKATPKPQITGARGVSKPAKLKKPTEFKKKPVVNMNNNNLLNDQVFTTLMKNSLNVNPTELLKHAQGIQGYADLLKNSSQTSKKADAKPATGEQKRISNIFEQMKLDYSQQIMEQMKLISNSSFYRYQNYGMDLGSDYFNQYSSLYNNALMGNYLSHLQNYKRSKMKNTKSRTVLKSKTTARADSSNAEEKKSKTNFNIDDILGKPSTSSITPQSPNILTPSQINMSIEDKIKNAFYDADDAKEQTEAINLSPNCKNVQDAVKRPLPDVLVEETSAKKFRRGPSFSSTDKDEDDIEIVVIDD